MTSVSPGGASKKGPAVVKMFGRIAPSYDLMNTVISLGLDRRWRRRAVEAAALPPAGVALDIGTGTGELAIELARSEYDSYVIGMDLTAPMIRFAPAKAAGNAVSDRTDWVSGDCLELPFSDETFDAVVNAFLLRNLTDLGSGFAEMRRVVRPGGRVVSLEISPSGAPLWRTAFELYFHRLVPLLGRKLAGEALAYEYLPASVAAFLTPDAVTQLMEEAGLRPLRAVRLIMGTVLVHIGVRP